MLSKISKLHLQNSFAAQTHNYHKTELIKVIFIASKSKVVVIKVAE